jgi:hypothetical protein
MTTCLLVSKIAQNHIQTVKDRVHDRTCSVNLVSEFRIVHHRPKVNSYFGFG